MKRRSRPISSRISAGGRVQFSALNEKMVRIWMPISPAARTVLRSASTPRRCPSPRGRPRAAAQRPFPSMMIATWPGTSNGAVEVVAASPFGIASSTFHSDRSDRHDLFFLAAQRLFDLGNGMIGRLLHVVRHAVVVVLADLVIFLQLLQHVEPVASNVAYGDARRLRIF